MRVCGTLGSRYFPVALVGVVLLLRMSAAAAAAEEKVLFSFQKYPASIPYSALVFDAAGNLYATTGFGGLSSCEEGCGTVFKLSPSSSGWDFTVLYEFSGVPSDGSRPFGQLVFDAVGNLYGATATGGIANFGTVFELSPSADESWTETVVYKFAGGLDGEGPSASPILDAAGNLYGMTAQGGSFKHGMVYELIRQSNGEWSKKTIYSFTGGTDGSRPLGPLVFDAAGNLYGEASEGGFVASRSCPSGCGTVFKLTPIANGEWNLDVLYSFHDTPDGAVPLGGLTFDSAHSLYGVTQGGGSHSFGTIFRVSPNSDGSWSESVLHTFNGPNGNDAESALLFDGVGNLYGTTARGGANGNVFELSRLADGSWVETVLHAFTGGADGAEPTDSLIFDSAGNLYATASSGGEYGSGVVFEITP